MKKVKDVGHYISRNSAVCIRHLALLVKSKIRRYHGLGVLLEYGRRGMYTDFLLQQTSTWIAEEILVG
jgi:hypothetical protein